MIMMYMKCNNNHKVCIDNITTMILNTLCPKFNFFYQKTNNDHQGALNSGIQIIIKKEVDYMKLTLTHKMIKYQINWESLWNFKG